MSSLTLTPRLFSYYQVRNLLYLEGTARYAGQLLPPEERFRQFFLTVGPKRSFLLNFRILGNILYLVVAMVSFYTHKKTLPKEITQILIL